MTERSAGGSRRGFASMDVERQREIAREGGRAAHRKGTAHEFSSDEARAAGRKGGRAAHARGTAHEWDASAAREAGRKGGLAVSRDRAHMAEIGRRGGAARGARLARRSVEQAQGIPTSDERGVSAPDAVRLAPPPAPADLSTR